MGEARPFFLPLFILVQAQFFSNSPVMPLVLGVLTLTERRQWLSGILNP